MQVIIVELAQFSRINFHLLYTHTDTVKTPASAYPLIHYIYTAAVMMNSHYIQPYILDL